MSKREGPPLGPYASLALTLADLGYSAIPLNGKRPIVSGWQQQHEHRLDRIVAWSHEHPTCNVGIVCGRVVAVDIDVLDPDLAHHVDTLVVARLDEGPLRIGQYPKRLRVFRVTEPLQKLMVGGVQGAKVEILASGQQFAAFGTHPDTHQSYTWPNGDLTEWALEDLPEVTPDMLKQLLAEVEPLLPRIENAPARAQARAGTLHRGGEVSRDATGRVIDGRDTYLSTLAFHTVHDAIAACVTLDANALASIVWQRFRDTADLKNAKGSGRAWVERDALRKVLDKLGLHHAGRLPARSATPENVAAFHPLPTRTADEARAEVRKQVRLFLDRTLTWHASPKAVRAKAEHAGIATDVGSGKTSISCEALADFVMAAKVKGLPHRILFTVPTHKLGIDVAGRLITLGLKAATWRGREAKIDPNAPNGSSTMCSNLAAVKDALTALQDVEEAACGKKSGPCCPFFDTCAYQNQKAIAAAADVVVAAHETVLGKITQAIGRGFAAVIMDEGWVFDGVDTARMLTVETLRAGEIAHTVPDRDWPDRMDEGATNDLHVLRRKLASAIDTSPDGYLTRAALAAVGLTAADCTMANGLEWRRKVEKAMYPGMSIDARQEAKRRCVGNAAIPRLSALWKGAGALLDSDDEATGRIEISMRQTGEGTQRVLQLHTLRGISAEVTSLPILLLDATMPAALLRHRLPRMQVLAEIRAQAPHMRLHHILGGFGKQSIVPSIEVSATENRRRLARIAEVRDFILLRTGGTRTLVVTYQDLEPRFANLPGVEVAHFNAVAGRDEWGPHPGKPGVRHLFIIGRPLPKPEDIRRLAAALTGRPVPRQMPDRVIRGATMRDGTGTGVPVRAYADPDMEVVLNAVMVAELIQGIGRGRGINRTAFDPLNVYLLAGDVVVPLPVMHLCRWQDVALNLFQRMAARGVILTSASDCVRAYPDLFPKADEAARKALSRARSGQDFRDIPLLGPPIGKCHGNLVWTQVEYRPPGRGQQTRTAWVHLSYFSSVQTRLAAATGTAELVHFSVKKPHNDGNPTAVFVLESNSTQEKKSSIMNLTKAIKSLTQIIEDFRDEEIYIRDLIKSNCIRGKYKGEEQPTVLIAIPSAWEYIGKQ